MSETTERIKEPEHFLNPVIKPIKFTEGVILKKEGNTIGIMVDPKADISKKYKKEEMKTSWWKYVLGVVLPILTIGGIPVATVITLILRHKDEKRVKFKLLFDAVQKLDEETIEKYLRNDELI